jgi:hypothetical protein
MDKDKQAIDKRAIEKFKDDMGFEDCSITKNQTEESGLIHKNPVQKIELECTNVYEDKYKCSTSIKSDNDEIIKSDCEKQEPQQD